MKIFLLIGLLFILAGCSGNAPETTQKPALLMPRAFIAGNVLHSAQLYAYHAPATFAVYASNDNVHFHPAGSGFFLCESGVGVTNHHVLDEWRYARVQTHDGREWQILGFYWYDAFYDLAVIRVAGTGHAYLVRGYYADLRVGANVYAIGSPFGYHHTFSSGVVSRLDRHLIQMTVPISSGSSGSALLNRYGQLVGVVTAGYNIPGAQALNFAVCARFIDLESIYRPRLPLPIAVPPSVDAALLFGEWTWEMGTYTFHDDFTGYRIWSDAHSTFTWRIDGALLTLSLPHQPEERWLVEINNPYVITIGGAWFARAIALPAAARAFAGTWTWHNGWINLAPNGGGSRFWHGHTSALRWSKEGQILTLHLADGHSEQWVVRPLDDNHAEVGGALFTRVTIPTDEAELTALLVGTWEWWAGWYTFNANGQGSRDWSGEYATFTWWIDGTSLVFYLQDGNEERWTLQVLGENEINIGGAGFVRR